jgi:quercetin dioxygenase-like cupin family protein
MGFAIVADQGVNAQISGGQVTTFQTVDVTGMDGKEWKVVTVELAPGTANRRHFQPGSELVYVLEGAGFLEMDGKPTVALNPGVVMTLQPKQGHVLKNASGTRPLKVLVVFRLDNGAVKQQPADRQVLPMRPEMAF